MNASAWTPLKPAPTTPAKGVVTIFIGKAMADATTKTSEDLGYVC